jgi:hypothetical protein
MASGWWLWDWNEVKLEIQGEHKEEEAQKKACDGGCDFHRIRFVYLF